MIRLNNRLTWLAALSIANACYAPAPNTFIAFIPGFTLPVSIAFTPNSLRAYVADTGVGTVWVINTDPSSPAFNTIIPAPALQGVFTAPSGVAATADGTRIYLADGSSNNVDVIDTSTNAPVAAPGLQGTFDVPNAIAIAQPSETLTPR